MTGRRPNFSDKTPSTGEKKNCIRAKTVPKMPFHVAAEFMLPPRKSRINFGNTGAINPSASMSSITVTKMNGIAAWRFFIAREISTQRCSGGCVNRHEVDRVGRPAVASPLEARPRLRLRYGLRLRRRCWQSPKAQTSGGQACQRVEDNAFHLGYFAR